MLKINKFIILMLLILCCINFAMARYTSHHSGNVRFSVAKPICRIEMDDNVDISNYLDTKPTYFQIYNYDKTGKVSDVALEYYITITTNQIDAPLIYKLYKINDDGTEEEIKLKVNGTSIVTINSQTMYTSKTIHKYKLKVNYNSNLTNNLNDDFYMNISVQSTQVNPSRK